MNDAASTKDWLGRTRRDEDEITLGAVQRLAATLDQDPGVFRHGSDVPESWYALLFGPLAPESALGPDGHPKTGDFLPPLHGTRRMFAGRRTTFHKPLRVGDMVSRVSTVTRAEPKTGRTGAFTLVTVTHDISGPSGLALTEEQDLVYRAAVEAGTTAQQKEAAQSADTPAWSKPIALDPVLVFRYCALTFNAHRVHYDLPYAREAEGYPALVMNGGLTALAAGRDRASPSAAPDRRLCGARHQPAVRRPARRLQRAARGRYRGAMGLGPRRRPRLSGRRHARGRKAVSGYANE